MSYRMAVVRVLCTAWLVFQRSQVQVSQFGVVVVKCSHRPPAAHERTISPSLTVPGLQLHHGTGTAHAKH